MNRTNCPCNHVSEEYIAKMIAASILRKAYESKCMWSKWVLIAALDEILGKPVPLLDMESLHFLQGSSKDRLSNDSLKEPPTISDLNSYLIETVHTLEESNSQDSIGILNERNGTHYFRPQSSEKEVQTDPMVTNDQFAQTEMEWKLIKITNQDTYYIKCIGTLKDNYRKSSKSEVKLFHGRPLIGSRSKMSPAIIPLECVMTNFEPVDPRLESLDSFTQHNNIKVDSSLSPDSSLASL